MSSVQLSELKETYRRERPGKSRDRLQATVMIRKGKTPIVKMLDWPHSGPTHPCKITGTYATTHHRFTNHHSRGPPVFCNHLAAGGGGSCLSMHPEFFHSFWREQACVVPIHMEELGAHVVVGAYPPRVVGPTWIYGLSHMAYFDPPCAFCLFWRILCIPQEPTSAVRMRRIQTRFCSTGADQTQSCRLSLSYWLPRRIRW